MVSAAKFASTKGVGYALVHFKIVTSLSVKDFELLLSLGLFNSTLMNSAIFSFKRYENASLQYAGFTKHNPKEIGLFDTKVSADEFYSN